MESTVQTITLFPKELKGGFFRSLDRKFAMIFGICLFVISTTVFLLSLRPLDVKADADQIAEIQERYARLVLNKPKPKPVEEDAPKRTREEKTEKKEEKKEKIDRKKESVAEKRQRKQKSSVDRQRKREQMQKKMANVGIFAAITASADYAGDGNMVQDLIGGGDVTGDLAGMNLSGESFAKKTVTEEQKRTRRETRAKGGSIAKSELGAAEGAKVSRRGKVELSNKAEEIKGEAASNQFRSQAAILQVVKQQQARLRYVFEKWLKKDPNLSGKLMVRFDIMPDGEVANVSIVSSTTNNSRFDGAITRYIKRWKFKPIAEGSGSVSIVYPFVFSGVQ